MYVTWPEAARKIQPIAIQDLLFPPPNELKLGSPTRIHFSEILGIPHSYFQKMEESAVEEPYSRSLRFVPKEAVSRLLQSNVQLHC